MWTCQLGLVEHDEIVSGILFDFWPLVLVLTIFNREMMKAKFLGQFLKIFAGRIRDVGPYDIAGHLAKITDVGGDAVLSELLGVAV